MESAWQVGKVLWAVLSGVGRVISWVASVLGGYERLGMAVATLMAGKLLLSVISLGTSFFTLGKAVLAFEVISGTSLGAYLARVNMAAIGTKLFAAEQWLLNAALTANPIGLVVAGVAAFAAGAYLLIKYWEPVKEFFAGLWESLKEFVGVALQVLGSPIALLVQGVQAISGGAPSDSANLAAAGGVPSSFAEPFTPRAPLVPAAAAGAGSVSISAPIQIYATPGMDEKAVAAEVDRKLRERETQAAAQRRGSLYG